MPSTPKKPPERDYPTQCYRCRKRNCPGRFTLLTCRAEYDGKNGFDEAEALMQAQYAPQTDVVDDSRPVLMECFYGTDILTPWVAEDDRRPRTKGGPRVGMTWPFSVGSGSAMHGECTSCVKDAVFHRDEDHPIRAATWRRQSGPLPENFAYCKSSYCDTHAKKVASAPIEVPEFNSAKEAQAWLDKMTEERTG